MINIAINGFGRIGRNFLRILMQDPSSLKKINIVAINIGPGKIDMMAHMFKYDSIMGIFNGDVSLQNNELHINEYRIKIFAECEPENLPWQLLNIDWVVECTGHFTHRDEAMRHIQAGARHVLISAPAKGEDVSIIPGINLEQYDAKQHQIVSLGSCTTNAFLPMLKVLNDSFEIRNCLMTTVHAYTNTQKLLDVEDKDPRRARAAALNIIPTSTGAMYMVEKIIPALKGSVQAMALRVPVAKVSLIDLTVITHKSMTVQLINDAFAYAAGQGSFNGILDITMEPLVSSDFSGNSYSVTIDGLLTQTSGQHFAKIFGWYDNEWGYSERLKDFLLFSVFSHEK